MKNSQSIRKRRYTNSAATAQILTQSCSLRSECGVDTRMLISLKERNGKHREEITHERPRNNTKPDGKGKWSTWRDEKKAEKEEGKCRLERGKKGHDREP